ncbi:hypothetical protein KM176_09000 [Pseudooceanicola sp. CBS1P-1]|uniref:LPS-assembly lipoprotein n=1 Tax=Pseudooceanicola albus TaxID=2692189 RepID=A0A6L7FZ99_9RHOB|nr:MULTISPECIES: LPS assembly lipoprotein LptE [Pseudooceanicola]MBT9383992.1 hypothetical protein [Pseudooceanicola endophyticus]MXN16596.1 hypothetical protein [Pseudooceanicola albus]
MSLSDRRKFLALLAATPLAACGFTPVYGPGGAGERLLNKVELPEPNSRDSYLLIRELEQRLGRPGSADYKLTLKLKATEGKQAISSDDVTTRFHVLGRLDYVLTRTEDDSRVGAGTVTGFTSYSATGTTAATESAREDAHERLMVILTDSLTSRLFADLGPA